MVNAGLIGKTSALNVVHKTIKWLSIINRLSMFMAGNRCVIASTFYIGALLITLLIVNTSYSTNEHEKQYLVF